MENDEWPTVRCWSVGIAANIFVENIDPEPKNSVFKVKVRYQLSLIIVDDHLRLAARMKKGCSKRCTTLENILIDNAG